MSATTQVTIHASQFPEGVRRDLLQSLHSRRVNHKFHYDSIKQAQKWLRLHEMYSPARRDPECAAAYNRSFAALAARLQPPRIHLLGLGCGGGHKDVRLLEFLAKPGRELFYTPADVSLAMVLVARDAALKIIPGRNCRPLVCDMAAVEDLDLVCDRLAAPHSVRLVTFFGLIPNFEPGVILPRLGAIVRPGGVLLFSANLAPGPEYGSGVRRVLPLYDNDPTRDWLMTFLLDLGVDVGDGRINFTIEEDPADRRLQRIAADFRFSRSRRLEVEGEAFEFATGDSIRLFFSYRYTPSLVRTVLADHGLEVLEQWVTPSEEEGIFLVTRPG
jgi:L-histidine Nalpha-methyltransferase